MYSVVKKAPPAAPPPQNTLYYEPPPPVWCLWGEEHPMTAELAGSSGIAARALEDFGNVNGEQLDERGVISACQGRATKAGS